MNEYDYIRRFNNSLFEPKIKIIFDEFCNESKSEIVYGTMKGRVETNDNKTYNFTCFYDDGGHPTSVRLKNAVGMPQDIKNELITQLEFQQNDLNSNFHQQIDASLGY